ncbi:MAG TPA: CRISPR-associated endoribonuclease Cas6 [Trichocoleus sp.]|jgi:CRISPR-associated endoribonuclease Cas6
MEPVPLPHLKSTTLHSLVLQLAAVKQGTLPPACNQAIHAQVLDWFRQGDPAISQAIHDRQESPLSLSGLMRQGQTGEVTAENEFFVRIGLLDGTLLEPLLNGLEKSGSQSFGLAGFPFVLRAINVLPGTDPWIALSDYALLAQSEMVLDTLTLKFLSPTSFKHNTGQEFHPFPLAEAVFGNLYRRWNVFAPDELKFPKVRWSGLVPDYELKTGKLEIKKLVISGAIGWAKYRFPNPEQARMATILAHFAFFSGVGCKTAMGMGQVMLDERVSSSVKFFANRSKDEKPRRFAKNIEP